MVRNVVARAFAGSLMVLALGASTALAQSSTPPAGGGSSAGPAGGASGGSGTPTIPTDLDLPMEKPEYQAPPAPPAPTPPPPPPDDPRDTPPPTIFGEEIVSENDTIIYVIDRSGSMDWDNASYVDADGQRRVGTRMERAKAEISRSILGLSQNFRFNIVGFDCGTVQWQSNMVPANDANKQSALAWVRRLQPQGATGTGPAVALGLRNRDNKLVVLLTDGEPNCGVPEYDNSYSYNESSVMNGHRRMISSANTQGAKINVFGIAASGAYRRFCQNVASDSGGSYNDVP